MINYKQNTYEKPGKYQAKFNSGHCERLAGGA